MEGLYGSTFGKPVAINVGYKILEDGLRKVKVDANITSGQAVTLDENGELVPVTSNTAVYGLSKNNKNQYIDETRHISYSGSGMITVLVKGIVKLSKIAFTASDGSEVTYIPFELDNWVPMDPVYVNISTGKLTKVLGTGPDANDKTRLGVVLSYTPDAQFPVLEVLVG